jgi:hypothetical protein
MKQKIILLALVTIGCFTGANAQNNQSIPDYNGNQIAKKVAKKIADTLNLPSAKRKQIEDINLQLHQQKMTARTQYAGQDSVLRIRIQAVENTRDSLYKPVIGDALFLLYKQKKRNLLVIN